MSNQRAYRNRNQAGPSGGWGILVPFFLAMILVIWPCAVWHGCRYGGGSGLSGLSGCGAESDWVWNAQTWTACGIWWGTLGLIAALAVAGNRTPRVGGLASAGKRRPVPPKGRLPVEVLPDTPAPPLCFHPNAVPVDLSTSERVAWLCPRCDTGLPAEFGRLARPCCGSAHGTPHQYNCVQGDPR